MKNIRLNANATEIKRVINSLKEPMARKNSFLKNVLQKCSEIYKEEYPCEMMTADESRNFMAQFEEGNQKIADEYFNDGKPLFNSKYKDAVKYDPDNPYWRDDIIRYIARSDLDILYLIDEKIETKNEELKEMRQRFEALENRDRELEKRDRELEMRIWELEHPVKNAIKKYREKKNKKNE